MHATEVRTEGKTPGSGAIEDTILNAVVLNMTPASRPTTKRSLIAGRKERLPTPQSWRSGTT